MKTTAGESTIGVNHVWSLLVVCLPALLLCHELQLGRAGQARLMFVANLLQLWYKMVSTLFIAWFLGTLRTGWKVHQLPTLRVGNGHLNDVLSRERSWIVDGRQKGLWANQQQKEKWWGREKSMRVGSAVSYYKSFILHTIATEPQLRMLTLSKSTPR